MAHLSSRHESARERRDVLINERSMTMATRGSSAGINRYTDPDLHRKSLNAPAIEIRKSRGSIAPPTSNQQISDCKKNGVDLAQAYLRCQQRVHDAKEKALEEEKEKLAEEQARKARNENVSKSAPELAALRLKERKKKKKLKEEENIDFLISQQHSSIEAMNIARMLSPRFQEKVNFKLEIPKDSAEEKRVEKLLTSTHIGNFYQ